MMSPELAMLIEEATRQTCATTDFLAHLTCTACNQLFIPDRSDQKHCSKRCAYKERDARRSEERKQARELKSQVANLAFSYLHRDRYFSFDGRYEGPVNRCISFVVAIRKDKGYHPMPIDVHVPATVPKFTQVTPEDVDWGRKQGGPVKQMPRHHNSFCACCVEMIIDKQQHTVRVTRGVYLPIEHECNSVRVYNLHGQLMEIKQL